MLGYTAGPHGSVTPYVTGEFSDEDFAEFMVGDASTLSLNAALGWNGNPGFLREAPDFAGRGLHILPLEHVFDVSVLDDVNAISYLYLGLGCRGTFDACRHEQLDELRAFAAPRAIKLKLAGSRVRALLCRGSDIKDPSILATMGSLVSLNVSRPTFEPHELPEGLPIRSAEFYAWSKLKDLVRLSTWPLTSLRLFSCKRIVDYRALARFQELEALFLDDCAPLPSASLLKGMDRLSDIQFQGTEFADKHISSLASLPLRTLRLSGKGYMPEPPSLVGQG